MLINLTNHPSNLWSKEQLDAASKYGAVVDIPFPQIDETADEIYIKNIVSEYLKSIINKTKKFHKEDVTIHIMGEMTFTYAMVNALKAEGYTCVASTTKRNTIELEDGTKQSTFTFNKFREYR